MKYVDVRAGTGWDNYFASIDAAKEQMPENLFRFAADARNYNLTSDQSLHDAWLEEFAIREVAEPDKLKHRAVEIGSRYLGPQHNLRIQITYRHVGEYSLSNPERFAAPPSFKTGHGDVLAHEVTVADDGWFQHEIQFSRGAVFRVRFREFDHRVEWISSVEKT